MSQEKIYLELSEGSSHKFYEVIIDGKKVTTRFGRIGDAGQSSAASFPTPEKAKAEAIKIKKGYAPAVMGARAKRSVTRRSALMDAARRLPYDLSGKAPRVAYSIAENVDIFWIDIHDGLLAGSDALGNISTFNHEEETQWSRKSKGGRGWMVRVDEVGVYHGHSKGVTIYNRDDGEPLWTKPVKGWIGFGWQEEGIVFASTSEGAVHRFTKKGDVQTVYKCDEYLSSCAAAPDGGEGVQERDWHVQFPRSAREQGARYVVDQVLPSARGGFYRALGNIRKLVT